MMTPSRSGRAEILEHELVRRAHVPELEARMDELAGQTFGYSPSEYTTNRGAAAVNDDARGLVDWRKSDPHHFETRHAVVVGVLGNDGDAPGQGGRSNPGVVQRHALTSVTQGHAKGGPGCRCRAVDWEGIESVGAHERLQAASANDTVVRSEDAEAKFGDGDHGDGELQRRCPAEWAFLFDGDEQGRVRQSQLRRATGGGPHGAAASSVESGNSSARSPLSSGSARFPSR